MSLRGLSLVWAGSADEPALAELLRSVELDPIEVGDGDVAAVYDAEQRLIACGGLERRGRQGWLRSLAVRPEHRRRGIAAELVDQLLVRASKRGLVEVWLMTETAETFFAACGFTRRERADAPAIVREFAQWTECPGSAVLMSRAIER